VNRQGLLTGKMHFAHPNAMQQALERENIIVKEDQVQDFQQIFWDPIVELSL
jgi:methylated-DNA-protein-cysteine methyltransferase-like protein